MSSDRVRWILAGCLGIMFVGGEVAGQVRTRPEPQASNGGPVAKIREITGLGARAVLKTPDASRGRSVPRDWTELTVTFDTEPEWVDELGFHFYALVYDRKKDVYTLFKGTVTHTDIARGRNHMSGMFLRPAATARYGEVVAVAVECLHQGEVIDVKSDDRMLRTGAKLAKEWWKSPQLAVKEGYIVPRSQTPFAFLSYDDYEPVK